MENTASFFIWKYQFTDDKILIYRDIFFSRTNIIYIDKIEMVSSATSFIMKKFGRCNLILTFAGNVFTLLGVPESIAEKFCSEFENSREKGEKLSLTPFDLLKKSLLQSHMIWYFVFLIALWAMVFLFSSTLVTADTAKRISNFVFEHMLVGGTLVLSIGLPNILIWIWALTGGYLKELIKYYNYTTIRRTNCLSFEYGLLIHRKIYITGSRIAVLEYQQTPIMRIFRYGTLRIRAVGYNPYFIKTQPLFPFLKEKKLKETVEKLLPEMKLEPKPTRKRCYFFFLFSWKSLLPFLCVLLAFLIGKAWFWAAGAIAILELISYYLEYLYNFFESDDHLTVLSKGGFFRTVSCLYTERIELIAISGSQAKQRAGYTNVLIHVFGKSGLYARIRNISILTTDAFPFSNKKQLH